MVMMASLAAHWAVRMATAMALKPGVALEATLEVTRAAAPVAVVEAAVLMAAAQTADKQTLPQR
jgi:hypothetical protein